MLFPDSYIIFLVSAVTFRREFITFFNRIPRIILLYLAIIGFSLILSLIQRGIYCSIYLSSLITYLLFIYIVGATIILLNAFSTIKDAPWLGLFILPILFMLDFISFNFSISFLFCLSSVPIKIYENADVDKLKIFADNRNVSGVYRWINKTNGRCYVGSSINLSGRFSQYYSFQNLITVLKNGKSAIARALLKYGYSNFSLEILEYCSPSKCLEREQYYLEIFWNHIIISLK
jgi:hypothetical protein